MVANFKRNDSPLLEELNRLPANWALVPIDGKKAPYQRDWQHKNLRIKHLIPEIRSGRALAVGVLCGTPSGGLLFLDHDGASCDALIGDRPLPKTVGVTSGRPGRYQLIYRVPKQWWEHVQTKKLKTGSIGDDGKEELLELRWNGCQSVVIGVHPTTGSYRWLPGQAPWECSIADAPIWAIEEMLADNAERSPKTEQPQPERSQPARPTPAANEWTRYKDISVPVPASIPLTACLSKESRDLLQSGVSEGGRNDNGAKLARDLIGTASYLQSIGQQFDGEPRQLLEDYARRCSPALSEREIETIWKSASKGNPSPACTAEGVGNCIKGFYWNQYIKPSLPPRDRNDGKGGGGGSKPPVSAVSLRDRILEILERSPSNATRKAAFIELASSTGRQLREIEQLADALLDEVDVVESRQENIEQIDLLLNANYASLDISHILPDTIAEPLKRLASHLALRPECYLTALLATVSSLHKVGTKVVIHREDGFEVTPNLFAGIVAPSSQKKSPLLKAIATQPLSALQGQAREEYQAALKQYESDIQRWESLKGDERKDAFPDGKPQKPRQKSYYFSGTTGEALLYQMQAFPEQGLLAKVDELAGLLKSGNQYRNGRGSDEEDLLSFYDGTGATILRADGIRADIEAALLAILGTVQPGVLQNFLSDCQDSNGKWARFIFVNQPLSAATMQPDGGSVSVNDMLVELYRKIDALPPTTYTLTHDAFKYYCKVYDRLEQLRVTDNLPGMSAVWGKTEGRIGKLAINIHVISELMAGRTPSSAIALSTITAAAKLAKFYAQQVQSLYTQFANPDALAPQLVRILDLAERSNGWIKARDVLATLSRAKEKPNADRVRQWFLELVAMGKGQTRGEGRRLEFGLLPEGDNGGGGGNGPQDKNPSPPPTAGNCLQTAGIFPAATTTQNQVSQPIAGIAGKACDFPNFAATVPDVVTVSEGHTATVEVAPAPLELEKSSLLGEMPAMQAVGCNSGTASDSTACQSLAIAPAVGEKQAVGIPAKPEEGKRAPGDAQSEEEEPLDAETLKIMLWEIAEMPAEEGMAQLSELEKDNSRDRIKEAMGLLRQEQQARQAEPDRYLLLHEWFKAIAPQAIAQPAPEPAAEPAVEPAEAGDRFKPEPGYEWLTPGVDCLESLTGTPKPGTGKRCTFLSFAGMPQLAKVRLLNGIEKETGTCNLYPISNDSAAVENVAAVSNAEESNFSKMGDYLEAQASTSESRKKASLSAWRTDARQDNQREPIHEIAL